MGGEDQEPDSSVHNYDYSVLCSPENWENLKSTVQMMSQDSSKAEKMLKIVSIYQSNCAGNGIRIRRSRINHSCLPNAIDINRLYEVRAISDILPGQEVTI